MFCIVSWHHEGRDFCLWGNGYWDVGNPVFFETRRQAIAALQKVKSSPGVGFLQPNVLDVEAFNEKFGWSLGPKAAPVAVTVKVDKKTGIAERTEKHESRQR